MFWFYTFWILGFVACWVMYFLFPDGESFKKDLESTPKSDFLLCLLFTVVPIANLVWLATMIYVVLSENYKRWIQDWLASPVLKSKGDEDG